MSGSLEHKRKVALYIVTGVVLVGIAAILWHFRHGLRILDAEKLGVWMDVLLGTALLAIIPLLMAAYGGHVAAESISDPKRRRNVKLKFWAICLVGVALAFVQQYRAITSDASARLKTNKVEGAILGQLDNLHKQAPLTPEQAEMKRREDIITMLRGQYILQHDNISPGILEGTEPLPADWLSKKLRELGERWTVSEEVRAVPKPEIIQQVMPEPKKAELKVGFYDNTSGRMSTESKMSIPSEDGFTVSVPVTVTAVGDVEAENGGVWFRVCEACNWAKEPEGFDPPDKNKPKDRQRKFQQVFPNVLLTPMALQIATPLFPKSDAFTIYFYYACKNCVLYESDKPQVLLINVTHPKRPQ